MFKHILVPSDGSELSQEAVRHAIRFAKEAGAYIIAFYARPDKFGLQIEQYAQEVLGFVENLCKETGVPCRKLSWASDSPHKVIIEAAEKFGCDLIFMASNGHKGINAVLLGSTTQEVLTHSAIPVLVYRPPRLPT